MVADLPEPLRVQGTVQGHLELSAPWGAHLDNVGHAAFYLITDGGGWVQADGSDSAFHVTKGGFLFVGKGQGYSIRDSPSTPVVPARQLLASAPEPPGGVIQAGGGGALTTGVFGCFDFDDDHPLAASLPAMLHLPRGADPTLEWMDASLRLMATSPSSHPQREAPFVSRLAEVLLIQVLRVHLAHDDGKGWVGALVDSQIARALRLAHDTPGDRWTVATLASRVGMSRTAFATRFAELVGEPPLKYLTRARMRKAAGLLRETDQGLAEIADRVGYDAEEAFSRAFKRFAGVPPGAFRRGAPGQSRDPQ